MNAKSRFLIPALWSIILVAIFAHDIAAEDYAAARIGFFPNITHAQALYLQSPEGAKLSQLTTTWTMFTAGPTAVESLFTKEIDASYLGPSPAINGFVKSRGESFVIVAGAAMGGAGLVVGADSGIQGVADFNNKTIATPQLGNTQDVAARTWFTDHGYRFRDVGGTLSLLPISPADQLALLKRKELDGAWTVEPWLSRLELEAGARLIVDEKDLWPAGQFLTTALVIRRDFIRTHPRAAKALVEQHIAATEALNVNLEKAKIVINQQLKIIAGQSLSDAVISRALGRVKFSWDPLAKSLQKTADAAYKIGFLRKEPELEALFDLSLINAALKERGLAEIPSK